MATLRCGPVASTTLQDHGQKVTSEPRKRSAGSPLTHASHHSASIFWVPAVCHPLCRAPRGHEDEPRHSREEKGSRPSTGHCICSSIPHQTNAHACACIHTHTHARAGMLYVSALSTHSFSASVSQDGSELGDPGKSPGKERQPNHTLSLAGRTTDTEPLWARPASPQRSRPICLGVLPEPSVRQDSQSFQPWSVTPLTLVSSCFGRSPQETVTHRAQLPGLRRQQAVGETKETSEAD